MKHALKFLVLMVGCIGVSRAQIATTQTTFSAAVTVTGPGTQGVTAVQLASCTATVLEGVTTVGTFIFADQEAMQITGQSTLSGTIGGSGACTVQVKRGQLGTIQSGHTTAAIVWVGYPAASTGDPSRPFSQGAFVSFAPGGSCTAALQYQLPLIVTGTVQAGNAGDLVTCQDGTWVTYTPLAYPPTTGFNGTFGPLIPAYANLAAGTMATDTTDISGQEWFTSVNVPYGAVLTGACWLNGTATTDKILVVLWDATGAVLANSAVAGAVPGTASVYNCQAFTATIRVAPGKYYVGIQGNGTTAASFWTIDTGLVPKGLETGLVAAGTFGTVIPIPAANLGAFTSATGPFVYLY